MSHLGPISILRHVCRICMLMINIDKADREVYSTLIAAVPSKSPRPLRTDTAVQREPVRYHFATFCSTTSLEHFTGKCTCASVEIVSIRLLCFDTRSYSKDVSEWVAMISDTAWCRKKLNETPAAVVRFRVNRCRLTTDHVLIFLILLLCK